MALTVFSVPCKLSKLRAMVGEGNLKLGKSAKKLLEKNKSVECTTGVSLREHACSLEEAGAQICQFTVAVVKVVTLI